VHRVRKEHEEGETLDCYFKDGIQKWKELNGTLHFSRFLRDIRPFAQSLTSILYHKDHLIETLTSHLQVPESGALEPLLW
jgi:hypothetical protein